MNPTSRLNYYFQDNLVLGETAHSIVITIYCILVTAAGEGFVSGDRDYLNSDQQNTYCNEDSF